MKTRLQTSCALSVLLICLFGFALNAVKSIYFLNWKFKLPPTGNTICCVMRKPTFAYAKTKAQVSFAVAVKLINTFVLDKRIVQYSKFPASSHLQCVYSLVCGGPARKPHCWFSHDAALTDIQWDQMFALYHHEEATHLTLPMRKLAFWVSDQVRHKLSCTVTEAG